MWPWEHLAFGYLGGSLAHRFLTGSGPDTEGVLALALGTQFPDLIDKPLAWTFDVLPSGLTLGHSLLFAIPLWAVIVFWGRRTDRTATALLFVVGHASHMVGDVLFYVLTGGYAAFGILLWPLVPTSPDPGVGLLTRVDHLARRFWIFLRSPAGRAYLVFEVTLLGSALVLWIADGTPGIPRLRRDRTVSESQ